MSLIRSENDTRQYRIIDLHNGLRAILIQGGQPALQARRSPQVDGKYDIDRRDEDDTPTESDRPDTPPSAVGHEVPRGHGYRARCGIRGGEVPNSTTAGNPSQTGETPISSTPMGGSPTCSTPGGVATGQWASSGTTPSGETPSSVSLSIVSPTIGTKCRLPTCGVDTNKSATSCDLTPNVLTPSGSIKYSLAPSNGTKSGLVPTVWLKSGSFVGDFAQKALTSNTFSSTIPPASAPGGRHSCGRTRHGSGGVTSNSGNKTGLAPKSGTKNVLVTSGDVKKDPVRVKHAKTTDGVSPPTVTPATAATATGTHYNQPSSAASSASVSPSDSASVNNIKGEKKLIKSDGKETACKGLFTEKMAAASLTVRCGSLQDPNNIGGVAHYLEHMLFLGSEKYPQENEYTKFISQQGGSCNAYTNFDTTTYYFEVPPAALEQALDMFANFFISPLLREDALEREVQAVDNEFQLNRQYDGPRVMEVLMRQAGNHPIGKFSWGNLRSLKEDPAKRGINMHDVLLAFYRDHYSADAMTLAVQSQQTLDEIEIFVKKSFGQISQRDFEPLVFPDRLPYQDNADFFKLFKIVPVTRLISLSFRWVLPSQRQNYREKTFKYLRYAVSHQSEDGLLDHLRSRQWALDLCASATEDQDMCSLFTIDITLTAKGVEHIAEVTRFVHQYLHMLRKMGPQKWLWNELSQLAENQFRFKNEETAYSYVCTLSETMQYCHSKYYLCAQELFFEYNPERIQMIMDLMTPDKCNYVYMHHEFQKQATSFSRQEPYMGTMYEIEEIPKKWKALWNDDPKFQEILKMPQKNIYVSTDFRIKKDIDAGSTSQKFPTVIEDTDSQRLWFRKDRKFLRPNTIVNMIFATERVFSTVQETTCVGLLIEVFKILIARVASYAEEASLSHCLSEAESGMNLSFSGFNHKLPLLIENVLKTLSSINCSNELFNTLKADRLKFYFNSIVDNATLAEDVWSYIVQPKNCLYHDRHAAILSLTHQHFLQWTKDVFYSAFFEVYVHGNVTSLDAKDILSKILKAFPGRPGRRKPTPLTHAKIDGQTCVRILGVNSEATSSYITNHYVYGPAHFYEETLMAFFVLLMEERCFTQLRTDEQLGYDAGCYVRNSYRVIGFSIGVSPPADKFTLSEVDKRIENFLDRMVTVYEQLSVEEFNTVRESLIKQKSCADLGMDDEVNRNWQEIADFRYIFDKLRLEINFLETLKIDKFKQWALKVIGRKREDRRKISVQVVGNGKVALEECVGGAELWKKRESSCGTSPDHDITKMPPIRLLKPLHSSPNQRYVDDLPAYIASLSFYTPVYMHPKNQFNF